jgi:hypothetical protein
MPGLRHIFAIYSLGLATLCCTGCGSGETAAPPASIDSSPATPGGATVVSETSDAAAITPASTPRKAPVVNLFPEVLIKTSAGEIRVKLNAKQAPITVENFLDSYVSRGFYPGTIVHYVDSASMVRSAPVQDTSLNQRMGRSEAWLPARPPRTHSCHGELRLNALALHSSALCQDLLPPSELVGQFDLPHSWNWRKSRRWQSTRPTKPECAMQSTLSSPVKFPCVTCPEAIVEFAPAQSEGEATS